jgi:DNA-binding XRE family transcriptional regulator
VTQSPHAHGRSEARTDEEREARWQAVSAALGDAIRAARVAVGLTQEQLAEAAGLHEKSLSRLERGGENLTLATLVAVADALEISVQMLFEG